MFTKQQSPLTKVPVHERAFRRLIRTCGLLERVMHPYFAQFGISGAQWGVLRTLHRAEVAGEPGLRLTDVSRRMLIRPPSVTGLVDRLEKVGLILRCSSTDDLRVKKVALTKDGRELVQRILQVHPAQQARILSPLDTAEQEELDRMLALLVEHLELMADGGAEATSN
jgi:DNA-binding MarR family transcriptional regulator